jgi:hypothetical protein
MPGSILFLASFQTIVKSAKYPVDNMPFLWKTITLFHKDEVPEIINLYQLIMSPKQSLGDILCLLHFLLHHPDLSGDVLTIS